MSTVRSIGRDPSCDIVLDDPYVSLRHATITQRDDGSVWLEDVGALNGIWVNGVPYVHGPIRVRSGDRLRFGKTDVIVP